MNRRPTSTEDGKCYRLLKLPAVTTANVALILRAANGLPGRDHVHGELKVHGHDDCPDDPGLPRAGQQSQQSNSEGRLGQRKRERLQVVVNARCGNFLETVGYDENGHEPRHASGRRKDEYPARKEDPIIHLDPDSLIIEAAVEAKGEKDGSNAEELVCIEACVSGHRRHEALFSSPRQPRDSILLQSKN